MSYLHVHRPKYCTSVSFVSFTHLPGNLFSLNYWLISSLVCRSAALLLSVQNLVLTAKYACKMPFVEWIDSSLSEMEHHLQVCWWLTAHSWELVSSRMRSLTSQPLKLLSTFENNSRIIIILTYNNSGISLNCSEGNVISIWTTRYIQSSPFVMVTSVKVTLCKKVYYGARGYHTLVQVLPYCIWFFFCMVGSPFMIYCKYCESVRSAGFSAAPEVTLIVLLKAGACCTDCDRTKNQSDSCSVH